MPAAPRKELIPENKPGIYHLWNRCVRGAFLMGKDTTTGKDYDHRKGWAEARLSMLVASFGVEVCTFSILDNHFHIIVRVSPSVIDQLDDVEIARRWLRVYPGYWVLDENWHEPTTAEIEALAKDSEEILKLRRRLKSVSQFMSAFSEYMARRANKEDDVTGRFWGGRFRSRELADEAAVLSCAAYVDLNELRAGIARTLEECQHSSIAKRIEEQQGGEPCEWLVPIELLLEDYGEPTPSASGKRPSDRGLLRMTNEQYIRTLRWMAENHQAGKDQHKPPPDNVEAELDRLQLDGGELLEIMGNIPQVFRRFMGTVEQIQARAAEVNRRWFHGVSAAARLFRAGKVDADKLSDADGTSAVSDAPAETEAVPASV